MDETKKDGPEMIDTTNPPPFGTVATFGPASPGNMIRITPSSGNVFADIGCPEPEQELAIAEAYAAWLREPGPRRRHDILSFRDGYLAGMKRSGDDPH